MPEITAIQPQVKRKKRYSIFIDDVFFFGVDQAVVAKLDLKTGQVVEPQDLQTIMRSEEELQVQARCLRLLERRAHSRYELSVKLRQRGIEDAIAATVLDRLQHTGLINDQVFAEMFIRDRMTMASMGTQRLQLELMKRGIDRQIVETAIAQEVEGDEEDRCWELAERKMRVYQKLDSAVARRRLTAFLGRRGFQYECIRAVMNDFFSEG
ncbi:recombination regulator RecX [bacterium]|nr:recombination regulator RecX [bacterium]